MINEKLSDVIYERPEIWTIRWFNDSLTYYLITIGKKITTSLQSCVGYPIYLPWQIWCRVV